MTIVYYNPIQLRFIRRVKLLKLNKVYVIVSFSFLLSCVCVCVHTDVYTPRDFPSLIGWILGITYDFLVTWSICTPFPASFGCVWVGGDGLVGQVYLTFLWNYSSKEKCPQYNLRWVDLVWTIDSGDMFICVN